MSRVKGGTVSRRRRKRLFNRAEGYRGKRKNVWRVARQAVDRAHEHAYKGRKQKKRDFRKLWIVRINAASRANGISYSRFMHGLAQAGIELDRRVLADLALHEPETFTELVEKAKAAVTA
ncbi:MAG: 50S ribosomal protein L20 [Myxococcales bacterium]|jgi:large subunit ribosomal protein L20|nr:50S ribosomal protein L20 [Myxococcales bacterium]